MGVDFGRWTERIMYTHFYGFSEEPFVDAPDPKFLFLNPGHKQVFNHLVQGIEGEKGWILLLGDAGSGKTLFIHQLLNFLKKKRNIRTAFIFHPQISFEDFLKEVLWDLDLPSAPPDGISLTDHFKQSLQRQFPPHTDLVILIDEAQSFKIGVLEEICRFFNHEPKDLPAIQLVLAAQPAMEEKLQSQELRDLSRKIQVRCQIALLTAKESQRYIDHRLHLVGGRPEVFAPEALVLILRHAAGVPRTINLICDNSLRIGHQINEPQITAAIVEKALREMYSEKDLLSRSFKRKRGAFIPKKILYPLAGASGLILMILIGYKYPDQNLGIRILTPAGASATGSYIKVPMPPAPTAKLLPPEKTPLTSPPQEQVQISSSASGSSAYPKSEMRIKKVIVVKSGNTLNSLLVENYGWAHNTLLDYLVQLNPEITDPDVIAVNEKIQLPEISEESLLIPVADGAFKIYLGTFDDRNEAVVFKKEAALKGKEIAITARKISPKETWFRLEAGNFPSKEEAMKVILVLKKQRLLPALSG
jgi:general secretion pathway protein A